MNEFAAKQIEENKRTQASFLDLGQCSLTDIPHELVEMPWIERLNFGTVYFDHDEFEYKASPNEGAGNLFDKADFLSLVKMPKLKGLYLSGCNLSSYAFLLEMPLLEELDLSHSVFDTSVVALLHRLKWLNIRWTNFTGEVFFKKLVNLEFLDLSYCGVPDYKAVGQLSNLKSLFLHSNECRDISFLTSLPFIEFLDIHRNTIASYEPLTSLPSLRRLDISENQFKNLDFFKGLTQLVELNFSENRVGDFSFIHTLTKLTALNLKDTGISDLGVINSLPNLKKLWLNHNSLSEISLLQSAVELQVLDLADNYLTDISPLAGLVNLTKLNLSHNQLISLDPISNLKQIRLLDVDENNLSDVAALKEMSNLISLQICSNKIEDISALLPIKHLIEKPDFILTSSNNPFVVPLNLTLESFKNHRESILNVLTRLSDDEQYDLVLPVKIVLLGNHGSGKTSLLHFILTKKLKQESNSTHVINIEKFPGRNAFPKAIFFDFGGQDYYHGIYRAFLTNGSLVIVLWDADTNANSAGKETSNNLPNINYNLDYWIGQKEYLEKQHVDALSPTLLMVVQSHAGVHKREWGSDNILAAIDQFFLELKAGTDGQGCSPSRQTEMRAARNYFLASLNTYIDNMQARRKEPKWYIDFLKHILDQRKGNGLHEPVTLNEISKFYKDNDQSFIQENLEQLHKKGLILYYRKELPNCVWLSPEKLVKYVHEEILSKERLLKNNGRMPAADLDGYSPHIIQLLMLQKVIFRYNDEFIIPNYLPLSNADRDFNLLTIGIQNTIFNLRFCKFVPFGLINQLICFYGTQSINIRFWRNQVLFCFNNDYRLVLITLNFETLEVVVQSSATLSDDEKQYLFYTILSLYWNQEPVTLGDFISQKSMTATAVASTGSKISQPTIIEDLFRESRYFPEDLYISVNGNDYMKYTSLINILPQQTKIIVYPFKMGKPDLTAGKEVALNFFQPFTLKRLRKTKKVFISYSHADKAFREEATRFLVNLERDKLIEIWQDVLVNPGDEWDDKIKQNLEDSDIILLLVSQEFINSSYVHEIEMKTAVEKAQNKTALVVPFLLKSCDWKKWRVLPTEVNDVVLTADKGVMGRFQFLPLHQTDTRGIVPLIEWDYGENAWMQLVDFLRGSVA